MRSVIPWSWSSYDAYQTCPRKFFETKIAKNFVEPEGEPLIWGKQVHTAIEDYLKKGKPVPGVMQRFVPIVDKIANAPGDNYVEVELACTVDLHPTGFWDNDAWCRGKGDLIKINGSKALATDWKTGKWSDKSLQLDLMSAMVFATYPEVQQLTSLYVFFQEPSRPVSKRFERAEMGSLIAQFKQGVEDMEYSQQTGTWPEKPSGLCKKYCPVTSCRYHGRGSPGYRR